MQENGTAAERAMMDSAFGMSEELLMALLLFGLSEAGEAGAHEQAIRSCAERALIAHSVGVRRLRRGAFDPK